MHGVTNNVLRNVLERLARFEWISDDRCGQLLVHRSGNLSPAQIERLHPSIVRHYLGQPSPRNEPADRDAQLAHLPPVVAHRVVPLRHFGSGAPVSMAMTRGRPSATAKPM